jgi:putative transposase
MGTEGFAHGMTPINSSEFENSKRKQNFERNIIEKELEGKLKDELLKKKFALEKKKS